MSQDKCGRCLKVTNPVTGQSVRAVVVDMCGNGGVDMERRGECARTACCEPCCAALR